MSDPLPFAFILSHSCKYPYLYPQVCCSDHQVRLNYAQSLGYINFIIPKSFHEQGFPATQVFERAGPSAHLFYDERSGD